LNDAVLRHIVLSREAADTEPSLILKSKDEKGDRRRRDVESMEGGLEAVAEA
jgi:small subunit ribosomal protein S6